jgi:hypothetical protein
VDVRGEHTVWLVHFAFGWRPGSHYGLLPPREFQHTPSLYQATLASDVIHTLQHLSFLGTGLIFWWSLLRGREGRLGTRFAVVYLFTTAVHTSLLGALLTFSSRVIATLAIPGSWLREPSPRLARVW